MDDVFFHRFSHLADLTAPLSRILEIQDPSGRIPWFEKGPWDPWNHTECAMALTAMGAYSAARLAFDYLSGIQRPDGAWFGEYGNVLPMIDRDYISREPAPSFLDSNFCAYPAVGVYHYLLATEDIRRVRDWWPMVRGAMDFVLALQRPDGTISWSFEAVGTDQDDALLAGNASIAKSLDCAIHLARRMAEDAHRWVAARNALVEALRWAPARFDRRGKGERHAMDWYYPILSGALDRRTAKERIGAGWETFVEPDLGCRCVSDEPWVTVAETCELAIALVAVGQSARAGSLLEAALRWRDERGVFWMGWQYEERLFWPKETPGWTQAAAILAADALYSNAPHSQLLVALGPIDGAGDAGS